MNGDAKVRVYPPLLGGTWWLAYCETCSVMCGQATACQSDAWHQACTHLDSRRHRTNTLRRNPC